MAKIEFQNEILEKLFRGYKWARNNSIQMLETASANGILSYKPKDSEFTFKPLLHQFQCLASTVDTYYRQLTAAENQNFGIIVIDGIPVKKSEITIEHLPKLLKSQLEDLEKLFKDFSDKDFAENTKSIQAICNHEYLHQGELIILMREAGVDLPERFRKAFAL